MSDLRTRIAAVLRSALLEINYSSAEKSADGEQWVFIDGTVMPDDLADAVIQELEADHILVPKSQTLAKAVEKALPGHKIVVRKTRSDEKQSLVCQCRWESNWGMENETRTEHSLHLIEVRKAFKYGEHYGI